MKKILLINGPNLNALGKREQEIYGGATLKDIESKLDQIFDDAGYDLVKFQSNHEGDIIDFIHSNVDALFTIINPAGLSHTSIALLDALICYKKPYVEIHISNIYAREEYRQHSFCSAHAAAVIAGAGVFGYEMAAQYVLQRLQNQK